MAGITWMSSRNGQVYGKTYKAGQTVDTTGWTWPQLHNALKNGLLVSKSIAGAYSLDDLTDVSAPSPGTEYGLLFNGTEWVPTPVVYPDPDLETGVNSLQGSIAHNAASGDTMEAATLNVTQSSPYASVSGNTINLDQRGYYSLFLDVFFGVGLAAGQRRGVDTTADTRIEPHVAGIPMKLTIQGQYPGGWTIKVLAQSAPTAISGSFVVQRLFKYTNVA